MPQAAMTEATVGGGGVEDGGPSDGGGGCREEKLWRWCHERVCRVLGTRGCVSVTIWWSTGHMEMTTSEQRSGGVTE